MNEKLEALTLKVDSKTDLAGLVSELDDLLAIHVDKIEALSTKIDSLTEKLSKLTADCTQLAFNFNANVLYMHTRITGIENAFQIGLGSLEARIRMLETR